MAKRHCYNLKRLCPLGQPLGHFLDNLLTTSDNLKQVATTFIHRRFDNLTTF
jgi:hypothetical protein